MPLHPQARKFLDDLAALNAPTWDQMSPDEGRAVFAGLTDLFGKPEPIHRVFDGRAAGVGVRVYTPEGTPPFPIVVYFHGGGWVLGDVDTHDALCRRLANRSECAVVSVDYRRSPEFKFPGPLNDAFSVVRHVAEHPAQYQADPDRIAVAGDSAGGNLAAAVCLKAREEGGPRLRLQLLIYPVIAPNFETRSYTELAEGYGLTRSVMQWFWEQYLQQESDRNHPLAVPMAAADLAPLPPAHFVLAEYDVLHDEGAAYARRLQESGVPTTVRTYDGMLHGFVHFAGVFETGVKALGDAATVLREAMTHSHRPLPKGPD